MKVGYSKTFPNTSTGEWEKVWCEEEFEGTLEQARTRWYAQKKEVENFHYESKGHDEKVAAVAKEQVLDEDGRAIADILLCQDMKELSTFTDYVNRSNSPQVKVAYTQKLKKLQNGLEQTSY